MGEQSTWRRLGAIAPDALADARAQLHWAARLVTAADALSSDADGRGVLQWVEAVSALVGRPLDGAENRRVGVRVADLCLVVLDDSGEVDAQLALDNLSADNALTWLKFSLGAADDLTLGGEDLPEHEVGSGASFNSLDAGAYEELARWYGNASAVLEETRDGNQPASAVCCSCGEVAISTWIEVGGGGGSGQGRRVAVGMNPGGSDFGEPHWYARPWPRPDKSPAGELAGSGQWHADGWLGAVLTGENTVAAGDAAAQRARVTEFVASALEQCRALLE